MFICRSFIPFKRVVAFPKHSSIQVIKMTLSTATSSTLASIPVTKTASVQSTQAPGNVEEEQYLNLVRRILAEGDERSDRTGTGTLSLFGAQMRFSLARAAYPLLTTKRVFFRGVVGELLWFVRGRTNSHELTAQDIHIWDAHGSPSYLATRGLGHRESGDLGPVYGWQWRHFGAQYATMHSDYTNMGVDQLAQLVKSIKENPYDRRHVLSAWNPKDLDQMALPPCHLLAQFWVSRHGKLSCQFYQRSCDMGLGVPFNIASYSLLTIMMAHVTGLEPGELIMCLGDAHVYLDHVPALQTQLARSPRSFPTLRLRDGVKRERLEEFEYDDFVLENYQPYGKIEMPLSV